jgi:preprotein translocase subunit SecG
MIIMVAVSIIMCFVVLIQNSKGGGLAPGFSSSNQILGVRGTNSFIEKTTWTLAALMVVISVLTSYTVPSSSAKAGDVIMEKAQQEQTTNPYNLPGTTAPQTELPTTTTTPATSDSVH